jgi:hypothetical protein
MCCSAWNKRRDECGWEPAAAEHDGTGEGEHRGCEEVDLVGAEVGIPTEPRQQPQKDYSPQPDDAPTVRQKATVSGAAAAA